MIIWKCTHGEWSAFREHTTTWAKYWQETNSSEMQVTAARVQVCLTSVDHSVSAWHICRAGPHHGADSQPQWHLVNQPAKTSVSHTAEHGLGNGTLALTALSWSGHFTSKMAFEYSFPTPNFSTQRKKTANLLLQLPARWSSPPSLGQPFQTTQL